MIVATVAVILILFGASGDSGMYGRLITNYTEDPIEKTITDEPRRELALKSLSVLKDDIKEFNNQNAKDIEQFTELIKNFESRPEDFNSLFSTMISKRQEKIDRIWDDRSAMLSHIQPEEWKAIVDSAKTAAQEK